VPGAFDAILSQGVAPQDHSEAVGTIEEPAIVPDFCMCGQCSQQSICAERHCCREKRGRCVLQDSAMQKVIDPDVVKVAINLDHHNLCEDAWEHGNNNMRHAAYRQFVLYVTGNTGRHRRVIVPSCVTWAIRRIWPSDDGHYKGFVASSAAKNAVLVWTQDGGLKLKGAGQ
jgi:hypothetical protein